MYLVVFVCFHFLVVKQTGEYISEPLWLYNYLNKVPYFINKDYVPMEEEDWIYYECLWCGIIDEMDEEAGIVISTNIDEVFLCSSCRVIFSC